MLFEELRLKSSKLESEKLRVAYCCSMGIYIYIFNPFDLC